MKDGDTVYVPCRVCTDYFENPPDGGVYYASIELEDGTEVIGVDADSAKGAMEALLSELRKAGCKP